MINDHLCENEKCLQRGDLRRDLIMLKAEENIIISCHGTIKCVESSLRSEKISFKSEKEGCYILNSIIFFKRLKGKWSLLVR